MNPKYIQLADMLRSEIQSGHYKDGQKLPSENELVALTHYSRQTVRQAMDILQREGLTVRIQGSGTYVNKRRNIRKRTNNIAVVTTYIGEYIFPAILQGIDHVLSKNNYTSLLAATRNRVDNERKILSDLLEKPIDGLIVEGTKTALPNPNIDLYEQFEQKGIPIVFINGFYPDLQNPVYVVADDRVGGRIACNLLLEKGHRNIAAIFKSDDIQGHRRYAGYSEALRDAGLSVDADHVLWYVTENRETLIENQLKDILKGCTALICYNDEVALQATRILGDAANRIEIVSFDHSTFAALASPAFFSLSNPKELLGRTAAQKLLRILSGIDEKPSVLPWSIEE